MALFFSPMLPFQFRTLEVTFPVILILIWRVWQDSGHLFYPVSGICPTSILPPTPFLHSVPDIFFIALPPVVGFQPPPSEFALSNVNVVIWNYSSFYCIRILWTIKCVFCFWNKIPCVLLTCLIISYIVYFMYLIIFFYTLFCLYILWFLPLSLFFSCTL